MNVEFEEFTNQKGHFMPRKFANYLKEKKDFLTMDETSTIYVRNSSMYKARGESVIRQKTEQILPEDYTKPKKTKNDVIDSIKDSTRIKRENFKEDPHLINLKNGVYNIQTEEFIENNGEYFFRHEIPVYYDQDAWPDKILDFFHDIVKDEDVKLLQEIIGYCLYRDYPFAKAVMLYAKGGNGKTTFLNLLERFLGSDNVATPSIHNLLDDQF